MVLEKKLGRTRSVGSSSARVVALLVPARVSLLPDLHKSNDLGAQQENAHYVPQALAARCKAFQ